MIVERDYPKPVNKARRKSLGHPEALIDMFCLPGSFQHILVMKQLLCDVTIL